MKPELPTASATTFPLRATAAPATPQDLGIEWDAENGLLAVKQGATTLASFTYDGQGRRATKTASGVTTAYVYDDAEFLEERPGAGTPKRYVYDLGIDRPLAQSVGSASSYFVADHLGSIAQVTDSAGSPTLTRDYDPWGNLLQGSGSGGYAYTGREWDSETSACYYRARYYSAQLGRFLSEDSANDEASLNRYVYVGNAPVSGTDPTGHYTVRTGSSSFDTKVGEAMDIIVSEMVNCPPCLSWFIGHNSDILRLIVPGKPPQVAQDFTKDWTRSRGNRAGFTKPPWDTVWLTHNMPSQENACFVAGALMHEFVHIGQQSPTDRHDADFGAGVKTCSVGRIELVPYR